MSEANVSPFSIAFSKIFGIASVLPSIAVQLCRLHDIGRSGWWFWLGLIPVIGPIVLLVFTSLESLPIDNRFGPAPAA